MSKRRNQLKGDLVEALQCLQGRVHQHLLFKVPDPSCALEGVDDEDGEQTGW